MYVNQTVRLLLVVASVLLGCPLAAQESESSDAAQLQSGQGVVRPVAILPFQERGADTKGMGGQVSDLLFAQLVTRPLLFLVEREQLSDVIEEQSLNVSGLVDPATQTTIGQLTGAKILIAGSVFQVGDTVYLVAKIIGSETSRVLGCSVKGRRKDDLDVLAEKLSVEVAQILIQRSAELVAKPVVRADRIAVLKQKLGGVDLPKVFIEISERHVGQATPDPAAETEFVLICRELGFEVVDPERGDRSDADIVISGEGFSEFATRHGDLISVKARLEVKAVDRESRQIIAADRQTSVTADLGENIAAKKALQDAAVEIAERLLPQVAKPKKNS